MLCFFWHFFFAFWGKKVYKQYANSLIMRYAVKHTDFFGGAGDLMPVWRNIPDGASVELMVHPQLWKDGKPDICGEIFDFHGPMRPVQEFLSAHANQFELATFADL